MPEISDKELASLRRIQQVFDGVLGDEKLGTAVKRKVIELAPEAKFADLEIADRILHPVESRLASQDTEVGLLKQEINDLKASLRDRDDGSRLQNDLRGIQRKYDLTDEGLNRVVELAKDRNNGDFEAVAALFVQNHPRPKPQGRSGLIPGEINLVGSEEEWAELNRDPNKWFNKTVEAILNGTE